MKKKSKSAVSEGAINQAATALGKLSWQVRLKRYGLKKLKQKLSAAGRTATHSGRPRMPDDQVKPNSLYQRARRERLRAQEKIRKEK
jgi:hypothetical protein